MKTGLQAALLVRHPDSSDLYVNFDPQILTLIRETECMARLGLEIPAVARALRAKQEQLKANYNSVKVGVSPVCLSVRPSVRPSIRLFVCPSVRPSRSRLTNI